MLENVSVKSLVTEGGFEAKLSLINPSNIRLVYLKEQVKGINVSMLINTGATNFFLLLSEQGDWFKEFLVFNFISF